MKSASNSMWNDLFVILTAFAVVLVKLFYFLWYKSKKNKK